jgi:8-oxo-dGTP diphosphatase
MGGRSSRHSVSVAGVVLNEESRALLIRRRDNGHWEPPGGVLEIHESIAEGLVREVREETGLLVEPVRLTGVYKNMARAVVALVFRCGIVGGALTVNDEATAFHWADECEVASMLEQAFAIRVLDGMTGDEPRVRHHGQASGPLVNDAADAGESGVGLGGPPKPGEW